MKRRLLLLFIVFVWVGCEEQLTIIPENSTTFGNITSEKDIESLLKGTGQKVRDMIDGTPSILLSKGKYVDEINYWYIALRTLDPSDVPNGQWGTMYNLIASANNVLDWVDQIDMSKERNKYYKGQCYFYIALAYHELIHYFGDCVLKKSEMEIDPVGKSPWTQVADYAIEMAEQAVEFLPELDKIRDTNGNSPRYKSAPCKGAANALLAQLCAWKAGGKYFAQPEERDYDERKLWERAEQACSDIINSPNYELAATPEDVCTKVLVENSRESLFETVFRNYWNETLWGRANQSECKGYVQWPVRPHTSAEDIKNSVFRIYASTVRKMFPGNDTRKYAYFYDFENMASSEKLSITGGFAYPYKVRDIYVSTSGDDAGEFKDFNINKIWWRLADIYLLRAECRVRLGGDKIEGAIADLNKVRERANAELYDPTEYNGDLQYTIFKEREKELLMEGYRYFDIIRNGYVRTELEGGFKTVSDQDLIDGVLFIAINPLSTTFDNNPLMRQNAYWQRFM